MSWRPCALPGFVLATWLAAAASAGCESPTLPLPPPDVPEFGQVSADRTSILLRGAAIPGALVFVFNEELTVQAGVIVTVNDRRTYTAVVPVDLQTDPVNVLEMWQRVGIQDSTVIVFLVPLHATLPTPSSIDAGGGADSSSSALDAGGSEGE
jgi:hypothetical protein